jgi:hypothetical protein
LRKFKRIGTFFDADLSIIFQSDTLAQYQITENIGKRSMYILFTTLLGNKEEGLDLDLLAVKLGWDCERNT